MTTAYRCGDLVDLCRGPGAPRRLTKGSNNIVWQVGGNFNKIGLTQKIGEDSPILSILNVLTRTIFFLNRVVIFCRFVVTII